MKNRRCHHFGPKEDSSRGQNCVFYNMAKRKGPPPSCMVTRCPWVERGAFSMITFDNLCSLRFSLCKGKSVWCPRRVKSWQLVFTVVIPYSRSIKGCQKMCVSTPGGSSFSASHRKSVPALEERVWTVELDIQHALAGFSLRNCRGRWEFIQQSRCVLWTCRRLKIMSQSVLCFFSNLFGR